MLRPSAPLANYVFHFVSMTRGTVTGFLLACFVVMTPLPVLGQTADLAQDQRFDALTWVQNSAEYRMLTEQTLIF